MGVRNPHSMVVPREPTARLGGFDPAIHFHDGWDLAYRLMRLGVRPHILSDAVTYHLYHHHRGFHDPREGFREQIERVRTIGYLARKFGQSRILLTLLWFGHLQEDAYLPEDSRIVDLLDLEQRYTTTPTNHIEDMAKLLCLHPVWGDALKAAPKEAIRDPTRGSRGHESVE